MWSAKGVACFIAVPSLELWHTRMDGRWIGVADVDVGTI